MRKIICILSLIAVSCSVLSGCNSGEMQENPSFSYSMSFYQEEYEEKYNHYEKELEVTQESKEISITGQTSSGKIDVKIFNKDGDESYNYTIEGVTDEKLELPDEHSLEWIATIDCYEDTDGSFEISVK